MAVVEPGDHYGTLGVSPRADSATIRRAYRALMRRHHPDVSGERESDVRAKAINEAYACLRDSARRSHYDWQRSASARMNVPHHAFSEGPPMRPREAAMAMVFPPKVPAWKPTWPKAIVLGAAAIVTALTFAATSNVPRPGAPAEAVATIDIHLRATGETLPSGASPAPTSNR
ncbi:J domain-containing protein [Sphingomonas rhizophila]|uniref:J domain-containing protein n=1 Tax=Sphingomonas rhizophila TaxID=2071607 RepID=A0A7G9SA34_9SPHN|nr:J domain-containing protein [Sphingomonas rhizophila]QNN64709.1 J domain-containing protein [Sphingomonas rhizophila]